MKLTPKYTIQHAKYLGSMDDEGFATGDNFAEPVDRPAYDWYPGKGGRGMSAASASDAPVGEFERRLITYAIVQVPDPTVYSLRDKVTLAGVDYFVAGDVMNYNTGPFEFKPGGQVFVERVVG